jgi:hypothetical protein
MTDFPESLWPNDLVSTIPDIPLTLIKAQAAHLGRITNNIVSAKVRSGLDGDGDFWIEFSLVAPALGNYEYKLFSLWHAAELYPIRVASSDINLEDESRLRDFLRDVFASQTTVRVVQALVAQARSLSKPEVNDVPF